MPLDHLAQRYVDGLFSQAVDRITHECLEKTKNLKLQLARRGLDSHQILAQTYIEVEPFRAEALMRAFGESLWSAYEAEGLQVGEFEFEEITREVKQICETRKSSMIDELGLRSVRTGRSGDPQLHGLTAQLVREFESSCSRVIREMRVKLDGQALAARRHAALSEQDLDEYDVFISYAGPDWDPFARPLKDALANNGLRVWHAEAILKVGDSLRSMIDRGIPRSRFGVVILSPRFFERKWPQEELDGLGAMETANRKVILPVWLDIGEEDIRRFSPTLAGRKAAIAAKGLDSVVREILDAIESAGQS